MIPRIFFLMLLAGLSAQAGELKTLNVKDMGPATCFAASRIKDPQAGGFGQSLNFPHRLTKKIPSENGEITLIARPDEVVPLAGKYEGMPLYLANRTRDTMAVLASDSQIRIVQEAKDRWGRWRPIEYLYPNWCGNSEHRVFLPRDQYWMFVLPRYAGSFATKLRAKFTFAGKTIVSNEYAGRINPGQFKESRKPWGY